VILKVDSTVVKKIPKCKEGLRINFKIVA